MTHEDDLEGEDPNILTQTPQHKKISTLTKQFQKAFTNKDVNELNHKSI